LICPDIQQEKVKERNKKVKEKNRRKNKSERKTKKTREEEKKKRGLTSLFFCCASCSLSVTTFVPSLTSLA
jgi:hypothetical protein